MDGASLAGCPAQKEPQKWGTDWRPTQSQEAGETNHQCMEAQAGRGEVGEEKNGGIKTDEVPGQRCKAERTCRYTCLQDVTVPEVRRNEFIHCPLDAFLLYYTIFFYFFFTVSLFTFHTLE